MPITTIETGQIVVTSFENKYKVLDSNTDQNMSFRVGMPSEFKSVSVTRLNNQMK